MTTNEPKLDLILASKILQKQEKKYIYILQIQIILLPNLSLGRRYLVSNDTMSVVSKSNKCETC